MRLLWCGTPTLSDHQETTVPSGRPRIMFMFSELYTSEDYICLVESAEVQMCNNECTFRGTVPCDPDVYKICNILMVESHLRLPTDAYEALDLYLYLRNDISVAI